MFLTKKQRIKQILRQKERQDWSVFEEMLEQYLSGTMLQKIREIGLKNIEIHVDFLKDYQCIGIQGNDRKYYFDIQIEPTEFSIGCDPDEPDDPVHHELKSPEEFYDSVSDAIRSLR